MKLYIIKKFNNKYNKKKVKCNKIYNIFEFVLNLKIKIFHILFHILYSLSKGKEGI